MIKGILNTLISDDFYNVSETIELAKGKKEMVYNWKGAKRKIKREWLLKKY